MIIWSILIFIMFFNFGFICGAGWYRLFEGDNEA